MPSSRSSASSGGTAGTDPRPARSRELILDAALQHFLQHGYPDATVDALAVEAGVAKRTVYNLFGSKEELFRAVIARATDTAERFVTEHIEADVGSADPDGEIHAFALSHARAVLAPRVIATRRLLIGESLRFPELAAEYFDRVPSGVIDAIAGRLQRYRELGVLEFADARAAAEHFAYLVLGPALDRALFQPGALEPARIERAALLGAGAFLRAYSQR